MQTTQLVSEHTNGHDMDLKKFLERIGFKGKPAADYAALVQLQSCFLATIPFENLDIQAKKPLDLSLLGCYDKIVNEKQGGVCFESNSLFSWALNEIGFEVKMIEAEMFPQAHFRGHFDHLALAVTLEGVDYLVDVGNGKYFGEPIQICVGATSDGEGVQYKICQYEKEDFLLCYKEGDSWKNRFAFRMAPKTVDDFEKVSEYIQTSPESVFTQKRIVTLYKEARRITLSQDMLLVTDEAGQKTEVSVSEADVNQVLNTHFGMNR